VRIVDTNIFLRAIVEEDPARSRQCQALFRRLAENEEEAHTTEVIVAEVAYVLQSKRQYARTRLDIQQRLEPLVATSGLRIERKAEVIRALHIYAAPNIDFEDALTIAYLEGEDDPVVISYDRDFDRVPNIRREEP
jgi:predicted nucleic acid-binding protein